MRLRLAEDEWVIVKTRAHRRVLNRPAVVFVLLAGLTAFALGVLTRDDLPKAVLETVPLLQVVVPIVAAVLLLAWCVVPLVRWRRTVVFLTNRRIVVRRGVAAKNQWELPLAFVRTLKTSQKLLERGSGSGALVLDTSNGAVRLPHLPRVERVRDLVVTAIERLPRPMGFDGVEIGTEERLDGIGHG
ncbi:PH domain-containing protein [Arthrobacter sp. JSM 101049]|uniref:PH domain-containing protein n=1 Tax=Arthrobacter sp. JSM 101049 TaxID=929097 RepID=UPI00356665CD